MTARVGRNTLPDTRRIVLTVLTAPVLATPLLGQERQDPEQLLRAKLDSPFLRHADWTTDYDAATRRARQRGQLVFGYFTTAGY